MEIVATVGANGELLCSYGTMSLGGVVSSTIFWLNFVENTKGLGIQHIWIIGLTFAIDIYARAQHYNRRHGGHGDEISWPVRTDWYKCRSPVPPEIALLLAHMDSVGILVRRRSRSVWALHLVRVPRVELCRQLSGICVGVMKDKSQVAIASLISYECSSQDASYLLFACFFGDFRCHLHPHPHIYRTKYA